MSRLEHVAFNVPETSFPFYRAFFLLLGWEISAEQELLLGVRGRNDEHLLFWSEFEPSTIFYNGPGLNHIAIAVDSVAEVDATVRLLAAQGVPTLFNTPRHRPEFAYEPGDTYYGAMFETPDNLLFVVVYIGPHDNL